MTPIRHRLDTDWTPENLESPCRGEGIASERQQKKETLYVLSKQTLVLQCKTLGLKEMSRNCPEIIYAHRISDKFLIISFSLNSLRKQRESFYCHYGQLVYNHPKKRELYTCWHNAGAERRAFCFTQRILFEESTQRAKPLVSLRGTQPLTMSVFSICLVANTYIVQKKSGP